MTQYLKNWRLSCEASREHDRSVEEAPRRPATRHAGMQHSLDKHPWIVEGQVLVSDGKPLQNCDLALIAQFYTMDSPTNPPIVVTETLSDEAGMFRIIAPSLEWYQCQSLYLVAGCNGHASEVRQLDLATKSHQNLGIKLKSPQPPGCDKVCSEIEAFTVTGYTTSIQKRLMRDNQVIGTMQNS